jgi:hypothetical protein
VFQVQKAEAGGPHQWLLQHPKGGAGLTEFNSIGDLADFIMTGNPQHAPAPVIHGGSEAGAIVGGGTPSEPLGPVHK